MLTNNRKRGILYEFFLGEGSIQYKETSSHRHFQKFWGRGFRGLSSPWSNKLENESTTPRLRLRKCQLHLRKEKTHKVKRNPLGTGRVFLPASVPGIPVVSYRNQAKTWDTWPSRQGIFRNFQSFFLMCLFSAKHRARELRNLSTNSLHEGAHENAHVIKKESGPFFPLRQSYLEFSLCFSLSD